MPASGDRGARIPLELETRLLDDVGRWSETRPFVVGIGGPSGVGKSTLAQGIRSVLEGADHRVLIIGVDDFFVDPLERERLGEWGPEHVRFTELRRVLDHIVAGNTNSIETMQYRRVPVKALYPWTIALEDIGVVLLEGLYAISSEPRLGSLLEVVDLPIFVEAREADRKRWRFQQEEAKPVGKSTARLEKHWLEGIVPDTRDHVMPSRTNADMLVCVDAQHHLHVETSR